MSKSQIWKTIKSDYTNHGLTWKTPKDSMLNYIEEQDQIHAQQEADWFMDIIKREPEPIPVNAIIDPIQVINKNTTNLVEHVQNMNYKSGDIIRL